MTSVFSTTSPSTWARARSLSALLLGLLALAGCQQAEVPSYQGPEACVRPPVRPHERQARIDSLVRHYVARGLPGLSVLVADSSGQYEGAYGLADIRSRSPMTLCTESKAASITKLHMGTLAHRLAAQGRLELDAPLTQYLSTSILDPIPGAREATLRQLMTHTTGIYDLITSSAYYLAVLNQPNRRWTPEALLRYAHGQSRVPLNNPYPASYSNTNTLLLMMAIEAATGEDHVALLRREIWGSLGLASTYMQSREALPRTVARGYYDLYQTGALSDVSQLITGSGNGYGGMYSTVGDLATFLRALFVSQTLVTPAALADMNQVVQEDTNFYCGPGTVVKFFGIGRHRGIGHTGRDLGYSANAFYYPDVRGGAIICFLCNYGTNGDSRFRPIFFEFEEALARVALD